LFLEDKTHLGLLFAHISLSHFSIEHLKMRKKTENGAIELWQHLDSDGAIIIPESMPLDH
jgi:hypothetical protein